MDCFLLLLLFKEGNIFANLLSGGESLPMLSGQGEKVFVHTKTQLAFPSLS
jgi:hypothetical protein